MPVTYTVEGGINVITITEGTEAVPVLWSSVVYANDSGGWGLIETFNTSPWPLYVIAPNTNIKIGNGTTPTHANWRTLTIYFQQGFFTIMGNAVLELGDFHETAYANWELLTYNRHTSAAHIIVTKPASGAPIVGTNGGVLRMHSATIHGESAIYLDDGLEARGSFVYFTVQGYTLATDCVFPQISLVSPSNFTYVRCQIGMIQVYSGTPFTLYECSIDYYTHYYVGDATFVDCTYRVVILSSPFKAPTDNITFRDKKTLVLVVKDEDGVAIEGASVVISEPLLGTVYSGETDENGEIPDQELMVKYGRMIVVDGAEVETWIDYGPYTLTITKPGYGKRTTELAMSAKTYQTETLEIIDVRYGSISGNVSAVVLSGNKG